MQATKRIESTAHADRKVAPRIKRVAETNILGTLSRIDLSGSEFSLMAFLIEQHGAYAGNQWTLMRRLQMSRRTLSRTQRKLCQKGLLGLRYDGKLTRYTIRLKGVEMALKSASSKGCATNGASIEYAGKDIKKESEERNFPSALPTRCPSPPEVPPAEVSAVPPEEGNPRLITRQASERVWTEAEVLERRATPEHPDFASPRGPEPHETYAVLGDRLAGAWKRETGYRWTRVDHKNLRDHIAPLDDPEGFLAFVLARWTEIMLAWFYYRTRSPAPPAPHLGFMIRNRQTFLAAWKHKDDLDDRVEEGRKTREFCLIETEGEARVNAREDRLVVKELLNASGNDYGDPEEIDLAFAKADELLPIYGHLPYARQAGRLFSWTYYWHGEEELPGDFMRSILPLAEAIAEDEAMRGKHPAPFLAYEILRDGGCYMSLVPVLARRIADELPRMGRDYPNPDWGTCRAALADDRVSNITEGLQLVMTKNFWRECIHAERAAGEADPDNTYIWDQIDRMWDRHDAELRRYYDE